MGAVIGVTLALTGVSLNFPSLMAGLFGGVFWLLIFSKLQTRKTGPADDGCILGPHTVSVTAEGISEQSSKQMALTRWLAVRDIQTVREHVFVMIDRNCGIIIPRRAFASAAEQDLFLDEIRRYSAIR